MPIKSDSLSFGSIATHEYRWVNARSSTKGKNASGNNQSAQGELKKIGIFMPR
jgi:hypothetical protein